MRPGGLTQVPPPPWSLPGFPQVLSVLSQPLAHLPQCVPRPAEEAGGMLGKVGQADPSGSPGTVPW